MLVAVHIRDNPRRLSEAAWKDKEKREAKMPTTVEKIAEIEAEVH